MQCFAASLLDLGQKFKPMKQLPCELGEMLAFDYELMIHFFKAFSLDGIAQCEYVESGRIPRKHMLNLKMHLSFLIN